MCLYVWALMLRVGRSVVVGHSGGCRCPGDTRVVASARLVLAQVSSGTCWGSLTGLAKQ